MRQLVEGTLVQRYKRFFADVRLADGTTVTAHCPNTGTMKTCGSPGDTVYLTHDPNPKRKLAYTWELTRRGAALVGVNTMRPNALVAEAVRAKAIAELAACRLVRTEAKYGVNSRIDLLLEEETGGRQVYVEVKNATMLEGDRVVFPDAVTSRGLKHLDELTAMVRAGHRAVMLFLVNRTDGRAFAPAAAIDPAYAAGLRSARRNGVEVLAYRAAITLLGTQVAESVPIEMDS